MVGANTSGSKVQPTTGPKNSVTSVSPATARLLSAVEGSTSLNLKQKKDLSNQLHKILFHDKQEM